MEQEFAPIDVTDLDKKIEEERSLNDFIKSLSDPKNENLKKEFLLKYGDTLKSIFKEEEKTEKEIEAESDTKTNLTDFKLTPDQEYAINTFIKNIDIPNMIYSIEGAAGTGKSTISSTLIKHLYQNTNKDIVIVAPTHQALKVIRNMTIKNLGMEEYQFFNNYALQFKTTYSFLGLKLQIDENGNEIFINPEPDKAQEVIYCDYLFVDESSMVDKKMTNELVELLGRRVRKQIIFIGDRFQAKPVNGEMNHIFDKRNTSITRFELKEIVRQKENSKITEFSQWLVECIDDQEQYDYNKLLTYFKTVADDIFCYDNVHSFLEEYFKTETDKIVGCYTNKLVNEYNAYIRWYLFKDQYPEGIPEYIVGDKLIMLQPYEHNGVMQYNNGDIVEIKHITYKQDYKKELYYWYCEDEDGLTFKILDPRYMETLQNQLSKLAEIAKASTGSSRRVEWQKFFKLKNKFAKVRPVYANTFHKLQGSTYTNTFIICDEFIPYLERDLDNILRLIYVAITRGKQIHLLKA